MSSSILIAPYAIVPDEGGPRTHDDADVDDKGDEGVLQRRGWSGLSLQTRMRLWRVWVRRLHGLTQAILSNAILTRPVPGKLGKVQQSRPRPMLLSPRKNKKK